MTEPLSEIRRRAQVPVQQYNDIAGVLVGDHVSIHVTRLFIAVGISPTVATISMLVLGLAGALLIPFGGLWSIAGFTLVFGYYICDCVDGEVARYHKVEKLIWGFHDFLFHLYVKSAFFLALGALAVHVTGKPWFFVFGISGLLGTLLIKFLDALAVSVAARQIVLRPPGERAIQLKQLMEGVDKSRFEVSEASPDAGKPGFGRPLAVFRAIVTNFDLGSLIFLTAAILDLFVPRFELLGITWNLKVVLVAFYGVVMPIDFIDRMYTAIRRDEFSEQARELIVRADGFRVDD